MIAVILISLLFTYIISGIGNAVIKGITFLSEDIDDFKWSEKCLTGLCTLMVWFNVWSLFHPLNTAALILPLLASTYLHYRYLETSRKPKRYEDTILPIFLLILIYLFFCIVPPFHGDSIGYHFNAIQWAETFKVTKGIANIISRLGFNSSYFTLSAPFTFSSIFPQPLFVVNFVLTLLYTFWIFGKVAETKNNWHKLLLIVSLVYSLRWLLVNLSSPSPDTLSGILALVVLGTLIFHTKINKDFPSSKILYCTILTISAFTTKLSCAFLVIIVGGFSFVGFKKHSHTFSLTVVSIIVIIVLPWIIRNLFISGYLIYPLYEVDLVNVDWKAPLEFAKFDRLLIKTGPRMIEVNSLLESQSLPVGKWLPLWVLAQLHKPVMLISLLLFLLSVSTAFIFIVLYKRLLTRDKLLWALNAMGVLFWVVSSPDYRFGYPFLLSISYLGFSWLPITLGARQVKTMIITISFVSGYYYVRQAISMLPVNQTGIVFPTHKHEISAKKNVGFRSILLRNNIRLFISDSIHTCREADLPCANDDFYPGFDIHSIKMRGNSINEGFKIER